jgi:hypothetical protein
MKPRTIMSSIMRGRSALTGRGKERRPSGFLSIELKGCWTFDARDRMPRSSPLTAHPLAATAKNHQPRRAESRESGFVRCPEAEISDRRQHRPIRIPWMLESGISAGMMPSAPARPRRGGALQVNLIYIPEPYKIS